jgi:flagellar biosynthesis protein FlhB
VKIAAVLAILAMAFLSLLPGIESWVALPLMAALGHTHHILVRLAGSVAAVMTLIAIADYVYQRFNFMQQMRMTKQELRDEFRQSDGDPQVKSRLRRLRNERAKQRMMAAVPTATVVITNPTHYAVALAYEIETMTAPKVVAKGVDSLALRIRALAEQSAVPVVENPPLARALHGAVEVDDDIPPEHYQAVAQIIGYVMRQRGPAQASR